MSRADPATAAYHAVGLEDPLSIARRIIRESRSEKVKVGLLLLLLGCSYREAQRLSGVASLGNLNEQAQRLGVRRRQLKQRAERLRISSAF